MALFSVKTHPKIHTMVIEELSEKNPESLNYNNWPWKLRGNVSESYHNWPWKLRWKVSESKIGLLIGCVDFEICLFTKFIIHSLVRVICSFLELFVRWSRKRRRERNKISEDLVQMDFSYKIVEFGWNVSNSTFAKKEFWGFKSPRDSLFSVW